MRCAGIPSRPITNFKSAHDANGDRTIDYLSYGKNAIRIISPDSVWNYHVWCEAWFTRTDRPACGGWQASDAMPQEQSSGIYQCGPAPVSAIKVDSGGNFDVDFVFAEVNPLVQYWAMSPGFSTPVYVGVSTNDVGINISTKAKLSSQRDDITSNYK